MQGRLKRRRNSVFNFVLNRRENLPLRAERSKVRTCHQDKKLFLAGFQLRVREYATEDPQQFARAITLIKDLEKRFANHSLAGGSADASPCDLHAA
jgi:hypothetical protein